MASRTRGDRILRPPRKLANCWWYRMIRQMTRALKHQNGSELLFTHQREPLSQ